MQKVLVTSNATLNSTVARKKLEESGAEVIYFDQGRNLSGSKLINLLSGCTVFLAGLDKISEDVLKAVSPTLKLIARTGVGYNNIDLKAAEKYGVKVTITPNANTLSVAELAMAFILSLARRIPRMDQDTRAGMWKRFIGNELHGKTLGVVGTGKIGIEVLKRAKAFGMNLIAYDLFENSKAQEEIGFKYESLDLLLSQADFVTLHVPATKENTSLINSKKLDMMKPSAYIINTARAELVDSDDLYNSLVNGKIAGAALDVYITEPTDDIRFFELENVILTPHAGASTKEAIERMALMAVEEALRVLSGKDAVNTVSK